MSLSAFQWRQVSEPPAVEAPATPQPSASTMRNAARMTLSMGGHPLRHRPRSLVFRVDRHQQEEREIDDREDAREQHVDAVGGQQTEPAQGDEAHGKGRE